MQDRDVDDQGREVRGTDEGGDDRRDDVGSDRSRDGSKSRADDTATARSTTLPRRMKSRKPLIMFSPHVGFFDGYSGMRLEFAREERRPNRKFIMLRFSLADSMAQRRLHGHPE